MSQFAEMSFKLAAKSWAAFTPLERLLLFIGSFLCGVTCLWTTQLLGVPREPGFGGSLLASSSPLLAIIVVVFALAICLLIGSVLAIFMGIESGLFCCCMGLAALSVRCGPIRPVLQYAAGPSVFLALAVETFLLGGAVYGIWFVLRNFFDPSKSSQGSSANLAAPNEIADATLSQKLMVTGVQIVVTAVCELILIQTDVKAQAMAGVCASAFVGVLAAYMFLSLPEGIWYWIGPTFLGVVGFALAYFNDGSTTIGDVHGWLAPLARATPLDYTGMGTAGALLAYWCSRRWAQPEDSETETAT